MAIMETHKRRPSNYLIGIPVMIVLFITAFVGTIFIMAPAIPLVVLSPRLFRRYNDYIIQLWLLLPGAFFEVLRGTKLKIYGTKFKAEEPCLIIMNHRCRLDWMFYWMVLLRYGTLQYEKILMRDDLKLVPGPGWAMQNVLYFFIKRRWEQDEQYMNDALEYYIDMNYPMQLLLFPEGTNYCKHGRLKSDEFAKRNNLPTYHYCLHPRVRGFSFVVQKLRKTVIKAIHDVTIAYPKGVCYSELDLFRGDYPEEVLVYIQRYDIKDIPEEDKALEEWCVERWKEKEERLRKMYEEGYVPVEMSQITDADNDKKQDIARNTYCLILLFWVGFLIAAPVALYYSFWSRVWFVVIALFYSLMQTKGGMDNLQLSLHKRWSKKSAEKLS